jgi:hypothetical protein
MASGNVKVLIETVLKVDEIQYPENVRHYNMDRCEKTVQSTGTHYFDGNKHQCGRAARFIVGGRKFCVQHAGHACLTALYKFQHGEENG